MARRPDKGTAGSDLTYNGSMAKFMRMCSVAVVMWVAMAGMAVYNYATIPAAGDPLYRQICVGVPGFWAVVLPLSLGPLVMFFRGQSITLTQKAFIYRRGHFTAMLPWTDIILSDIDDRKWDPNFTVSIKGTSYVVVRSLFFPEYDDILASVERRLKNREANLNEVNL